MKHYFRHKLQNLIVVSKVITIHYFEFDKNFRAQEEAHDFWELVYADKENIFCTADDKIIPLAQGEMLFHKPNVRHSLFANGKKAPNVCIVSFECKSEAMRFFEDRKLRPDKSFLRFLYGVIEEGKRTFDIPFSSPECKKMNLLATPTLGGCSKEALYKFSVCCIENSRDLLQILEAEYRKLFGKNLTLSRLPEAVILPLCPDKGSCMEYDENLAASVYLENDLEMLGRMKEFML